MTRKQLETIRDSLNQKYYGNKAYLPCNLEMPITDDDKQMYKELDCIEMINSCLTYGSDPFEKINKWWYGHGYCERSYMSDYEEALGEKRVRELYEMQVEEFSKATIYRNVHTDSEGMTYNSVSFVDDK